MRAVLAIVLVLGVAGCGDSTPVTKGDLKDREAAREASACVGQIAQGLSRKQAREIVTDATRQACVDLAAEKHGRDPEKVARYFNKR